MFLSRKRVLPENSDELRSQKALLSEEIGSITPEEVHEGQKRKKQKVCSQDRTKYHIAPDLSTGLTSNEKSMLNLTCPSFFSFLEQGRTLAFPLSLIPSQWSTNPAEQVIPKKEGKHETQPCSESKSSILKVISRPYSVSLSCGCVYLSNDHY